MRKLYFTIVINLVSESFVVDVVVAVVVVVVVVVVVLSVTFCLV